MALMHEMMELPLPDVSIFFFKDSFQIFIIIIIFIFIFLYIFFSLCFLGLEIKSPMVCIGCPAFWRTAWMCRSLALNLSTVAPSRLNQSYRFN